MSFIWLLAVFLVNQLTGSDFATNDALRSYFISWKQKYSKQWGSIQEEEAQFSRWKRNYEFVRQHNKANDLFTVELNQFADVDFANAHIHLSEFEQSITASAPPRQRMRASAKSYPTSFDWRTQGVLPPVVVQGQLGDSFAITVKEALESYATIKEGILLSLSVQEIIDCCTLGGAFGADVWTCIHNLGGVCSSQDYPIAIGKCHNSTCAAAVQISGGSWVNKGDENGLIGALLKNPVAAVIDASQPSFQLYKSGIYSSPGCGQSLDHGLLVVGYGSIKGQDYWILQNSWGTSWGMKGFMLMARNAKNMCGIASFASIPV